MADKYRNFAELSRAETEGVDFRIHTRLVNSPYAVMAIHGGRIEHGTRQIADVIAGTEHCYYCFEGIKDPSHHLHITSNHFDEPNAIQITQRVKTVVTVHGAYGQRHKVYLGGRDETLKQYFIEVLNEVGFETEHDPSPTRQGLGKTNICNRGGRGKGVQIELPQGFRKSLFIKPDYKRGHWQPNERLFTFSAAIRKVLHDYNQSIVSKALSP